MSTCFLEVTWLECATNWHNIWNNEYICQLWTMYKAVCPTGVCGYAAYCSWSWWMWSMFIGQNRQILYVYYHSVIFVSTYNYSTRSYCCWKLVNFLLVFSFLSIFGPIRLSWKWSLFLRDIAQNKNVGWCARRENKLVFMFYVVISKYFFIYVEI